MVAPPSLARSPARLRNPCGGHPGCRAGRGCGADPGRAILPGMPNHPVREELDLLDGRWYSTEPHDDWTWMREHAPVYYDPNSDVWAITKYDDVLAIEKDAKGFSSYKAPRPHGEPLPMM